MVVHYPRTVWKNRYAEHEVTGKTYNLKKKKMLGGPSGNTNVNRSCGMWNSLLHSHKALHFKQLVFRSYYNRVTTTKNPISRDVLITSPTQAVTPGADDPTLHLTVV